MKSAPALTTLVTGPSAAAREGAIASSIQEAHEDPTAVALILEGLPNGSSPLEVSADDFVNIARIAPGCICCTGNLTMRVTLNRSLRYKPARLYISIANSGHLDRIQQFLAQAPYAGLLQLTKVLQA